MSETIKNLAEGLAVTYGGTPDERRAYERGFLAYHELLGKGSLTGAKIAERDLEKRRAMLTAVDPDNAACPVCGIGYDGRAIPGGGFPGIDTCEKCLAYMKAGIICIETTNDGKMKTGRAAVLRDRDVRELMSGTSIEKLIDTVIEARVAYVPAAMYADWVAAQP